MRGILCIGEYGRLIELNKAKSEKDLAVFRTFMNDTIIKTGFNSHKSNIKQAAAIAFGNIIVGNPKQHLGDLFKMIKVASNPVNFVRTILEVVKHAPKVLAA
jgi:hypothetical protein